jgi:hypothetical protein
MATQLVELRSAVVDEHLPAVFEIVNAWPPIFQALSQALYGLFDALRDPTWLLITSTTGPAADGAKPSLPNLARDCRVDSYGQERR